MFRVLRKKVKSSSGQAAGPPLAGRFGFKTYSFGQFCPAGWGRQEDRQEG